MKFVFLLKSRLIFKILYCFYMLVNKYFINTGAYISQSKRYYNAKPLAYCFYVRTKILLNFHVFISGLLQNFVIKMGESSCQISATAFTLANSYGLY